VIEHVVVISGVLDLCLQGSGIRCSREGRRFAGDAAHAYRNSGVQAAHFHSLIHYPKKKPRANPRPDKMTDDNHSQRDEENPEYVMTVLCA
jgi:hypothetical protein